MNAINLLPKTPRAFQSTIQRNSIRMVALVFSLAVLSSALPAIAANHIESKTVTKTTLKASPTHPTEGAKVVFTATVSPSKATGTVTFSVSGEPGSKSVSLAGGVAKATVDGVPSGTYTIKAKYNGSSKYDSSDATVKVVVKK